MRDPHGEMRTALILFSPVRFNSRFLHQNNMNNEKISRKVCEK